jgi:hypothetical protein
MLLLLASLLVGSIASSAAQSGRRAPKTAAPTVEAPKSPDTTATTVPKPKPTLLLNVGMNENGGFADLPLYFYSAALHTVIERLSQDASVKVNDAGNMTRGNAVNNAKAEKEGYVVFLELKLDGLNSDGYSDNAKDAVIEYWVFTPATAKVATSGHAYPRAYQNKSVIVRPNSSGIYNNSYLLDLAAKAAAEQILDYFKNHKPADTKLPSPFNR